MNTWQKLLLSLLLAAGILAAFVRGIADVERGRLEQGREQLETVLHRAAAACYAAEGSYPPDLRYLCDNYGVHYDADRYLVSYEIFASNLMPQITVWEK